MPRYFREVGSPIEPAGFIDPGPTVLPSHVETPSHYRNPGPVSAASREGSGGSAVHGRRAALGGLPVGAGISYIGFRVASETPVFHRRRNATIPFGSVGPKRLQPACRLLGDPLGLPAERIQDTLISVCVPRHLPQCCGAARKAVGGGHRLESFYHWRAVSVSSAAPPARAMCRDR